MAESLKSSTTSKKLNPTEILERARRAGNEYKLFNQEQIDSIVRDVYEAGFNHRIHLAKMAYNETGLGNWIDKAFKNVIATRFVYEDIKNLKTVGVISEDSERGIVEIAQPIGPVFAVTPITNPTATVLNKILIAIKTRNPLIIRPHGAAKKSSIEAAKICYEAALKAGTPEDCVQWIKRSTTEQTLEFMSHRFTALILATGSVSLVRAAYRSGNPAIGVGPGNVPVYIGMSADIRFAVEQILLSKTFDYGTVCASEQAVIVRNEIEKEVVESFENYGAYFLSDEETQRVETIAFNKAMKVMKTEVIGQPAPVIAKMADIDVPANTTCLIAKLTEVGIRSPLSLEILAPILAFYTVSNFDEGIQLCREINSHGGLGHTASIFSENEKKIRYFANVINAGRVLVNTPAAQGAIGGTFNTLQPSFTLACGSGGKNITTDNISAKHLLNIQRIARRNVDRCFEMHIMDEYLDESLTAGEIEEKCKIY